MTTGMAVLERTASGRCARLPALTEAGLAHAFSCRDLRPGGDGAAEEAALAAHLGRPELPRARLRQRHGTRIHRAGGDGPAAEPPVGDALIADGPGVALTIRTADCAPLLVLEPRRRLAAAVHAGWRGTLAGILPAVLRRLRDELGADPGEVRIGLGPAIRACCYEVGEEVAEAFRRRWPAGESWFVPGRGSRPHLDLAAANRDQAAAEGVPAAAFLDGGWCTCCRRDLFYSYRGDGPGTGRIVSLSFLSGA